MTLIEKLKKLSTADLERIWAMVAAMEEENQRTACMEAMDAPAENVSTAHSATR